MSEQIVSGPGQDLYAVQQEWLATAVNALGWPRVSAAMCDELDRVATDAGLRVAGPVATRAAQTSRSLDGEHVVPGWMDDWLHLWVVTASAPTETYVVVSAENAEQVIAQRGTDDLQ